MKVSTSLSEAQIEDSHENEPLSRGIHTFQNRAALAVYAIALAFSIALWFLAIRSPLDTDETNSYWQISAGVSKIWSRQFLLPSCLPYEYILWFWSKLFGTSEVALRALSVLAMLGAVYLLYRAAQEIFDRETALFTVIVFCIHPDILLASIDVRPYAFAALATSLAIFILIRLRRSSSNWLAAMFGLSAACIFWFQFLFAVILPALAACFFMVKVGDRRTAWRQFGVALATFTLAFLPAVPGLLYLLRTRETHVCDTAPNLGGLIMALAPGRLLLIFICLAPVVLLFSTFSTRRRDGDSNAARWQILLCAALALIPTLILYGISVWTPIHIFTSRYRMISIPGIALCWALILGRFRPQVMRLLFCILFVALSSWFYVYSPTSRQHEVSWKNALEVAERNASADNAPVLICGAFIESDYAVMPIESAKTSPLFAPLSYYRLSVPVVPLPRDFNSETVRVGSLFLQHAEQKHERFLAVEPFGSHRTLEWIERRTSAAYTFRKLEDRDGFEVLEFLPRPGS